MSPVLPDLDPSPVTRADLAVLLQEVARLRAWQQFATVWMVVALIALFVLISALPLAPH